MNEAYNTGILSLFNTQLDDDILTIIRNAPLIKIELDRCRIGDKEIAKIVRALENNTSLQEIDFNNNLITEVGCISIAKLLSRSTLLRNLVLDCNKIGDVGAITITKSLMGNTSLRMIELRACEMGNGGAAAIAEFLQENASLKALHLNSNIIGMEGLIKIATTLTNNKSLHILSMAYNAYTLANKSRNNNILTAEIANFLATDLQELDLTNNNLDERDMIDIAQAMTTNTTLQKLKLMFNQTGNGIYSLLRVLHANTSIRVLLLSARGSEDIIQVANLLRTNTHIRELSVHVYDPSIEKVKSNEYIDMIKTLN